jgi:hypothetical protein
MPKSDLLQFICEQSIKGEVYKDEIEFGPALTLKNEDWRVLTIEALNERLRTYLIYRFIGGLERAYDVRFMTGNSFGSFNYIEGLKKYALSDIIN